MVHSEFARFQRNCFCDLPANTFYFTLIFREESFFPSFLFAAFSIKVISQYEIKQFCSFDAFCALA